MQLFMNLPYSSFWQLGNNFQGKIQKIVTFSISFSLFPYCMWILWQFCSWVRFLSFGCVFVCGVLVWPALVLFPCWRYWHRFHSSQWKRGETGFYVCTKYPWNSVVRSGLRRSMKHMHIIPLCPQKGHLIHLFVSKAMPCQLWASDNCRHGENHTAFFTVADNKVHSGSHWPFLKRCPAISQLQMMLSNTTKSWSGSESIMLLVLPCLWLTLLFFRFVIAPSPDLSF